MELVNQVAEVFEIFNNEINDNVDYNFLPKKEIDDIPMVWFKAAEISLMKKDRILNKNTVERLAADSWRQKQLE